jgi:hypothetical protein
MYNLGIDFLYLYYIMIYLTKTSKKRGKQRMRGGDNDSRSLSKMEEGLLSSRSLSAMEEGRLLPMDMDDVMTDTEEGRFLPADDDITTVLDKELVKAELPRTADGKIPSTHALEAAGVISKKTDNILKNKTPQDKTNIRRAVEKYLNKNLEPPFKGGTRRRRRAKSSKKRRGKRSRRA